MQHIFPRYTWENSLTTTSGEGFFHHYLAHQIQHDTSKQCDSRMLFVHIEPQHELPAAKILTIKTLMSKINENCKSISCTKIKYPDLALTVHVTSQIRMEYKICNKIKF